MDNEVIAAIIESCGAIIAALIVALSARIIVKKSITSNFRTYGDRSHNAKDILIHSQNDIFVVVAIGDRFIFKYKKCLEKLLKNGIKIRYLLLTENRLKETVNYIHGNNIDISFRKDIIKDIKKLKDKYQDIFECREFDSMMTASYICVDTIFNPPTKQFISSSIIQVMLYQYKIQANTSPITYISPQTDKKEFLNTVECIKQMWEDSKPI